MTLLVRERVPPLMRLHDEMDRMFQDFPFPMLWGEQGDWAPALDLYEKDGSFVVEAELPGMTREDVKLTYTDHRLVIEGETRKETEEKREGYFRAERRCGSFYRLVPLPERVDFKKAKAEFKDGVLTVTFPKMPKPEEKARTIPIGG